MTHTPPLILYTSPAFFMTLVLTGCGSGMNFTQNGSSAQGAAPTVTGVATQVNGDAPNRKQEVQFSEAMPPTTINSQSFQVVDASGNLMPGTVTYDSEFETASFLPNPALKSGTTYTATITKAAASAGERASGERIQLQLNYAHDERHVADIGSRCESCRECKLRQRNDTHYGHV